MKHKNYFFKGSKWTKHFITCIAALFLFTGTACASKAPVQQPQAPGTAAVPETPDAPGIQAPSDTGGQISSEDARNAALSDAGIAASEATFTKEKLDYEDGIAVYDLEFYTSTEEYEYEINAATGAVYSKSAEAFQGSHTQHNGNGHSHSSQASGSSSDIGMEAAKSMALAHAGLSADRVSFSKVELDTDDGLFVYEVEFYCDGREYEYKLLASDGSVLEYEMD